MTIEELEKLDNTFNQANFISKCNNIFVKFFTAIMMDNLNEVDHFISDKVYQYGEDIISPLRNKNYKQIYDELNVKNSRIQQVSKENNNYKIVVFLESRYMDYIIDENGNTIEGNDTERIQVDYILTFTKRINATDQGIAKICDSCGSPMNVNSTGICEFCGSTYKQEKHDWVLTNIERQ